MSNYKPKSEWISKYKKDLQNIETLSDDNESDDDDQYHQLMIESMLNEVANRKCKNRKKEYKKNSGIFINCFYFLKLLQYLT